MSSTGTVFSEPRRAHGQGKAFVTSLEVGQVVQCDFYERRKLEALARIYKVRVARVPEGLKRIV